MMFNFPIYVRNLAFDDRVLIHQDVGEPAVSRFPDSNYFLTDRKGLAHKPQTSLHREAVCFIHSDAFR